MSIDPRVMKTLLQLQFMPSLDMSGDSAASDISGSGDGTDMFSNLLEQMMTQASAGGAEAMPQPTASAEPGSLAPLLGASWNPNILQAGEPAPDSGVPTAYDSYIQEASAKYGIEPSLIKAVIDSESSFNSNAVSPAGAKGLMQLMDGTARGLGVTDAFDPKQNIDGGTRYLSYLMSKYDGNVKAALAAYNAGPGRVDRAGIATNADLEEKLHHLPAETQRYVAKVLDAQSKYSMSV